MTLEALKELYDYGYWANRRLTKVIETLTPEEFALPVANGGISVQSAWVHTMSAEAGWLERCGGAERGRRFSPEDFPTPQSVLQVWSQVEANIRAFLSGLQEEDMGRFVEYTLGSPVKCAMPLGEMLHHAANHGVHHRGQIVLLLCQLGKDPENFDILIYYAEKRGTRPW